MTGTTSNRLPSSLVCFVADDPRTPITCGLRNTPRSGARSAMSSPYRYAEDITARSTAAAMKPHGGETHGIDPTVNARTLWLASHPLPVTDEGGTEILGPRSALIPHPATRSIRQGKYGAGRGTQKGSAHGRTWATTVTVNVIFLEIGRS